MLLTCNSKESVQCQKRQAACWKREMNVQQIKTAQNRIYIVAVQTDVERHASKLMDKTKVFFYFLFFIFLYQGGYVCNNLPWTITYAVFIKRIEGEAKPGYCPILLPPDKCPTTTKECSSDNHCYGNQKCCSDSCTLRCTDPMSVSSELSKYKMLIIITISDVLDMAGDIGYITVFFFLFVCFFFFII